MRKTIKLTERDLLKIVKKVVKEGVNITLPTNLPDYTENNKNTTGTFRIDNAGSLYMKTSKETGETLVDCTNTPL